MSKGPHLKDVKKIIGEIHWNHLDYGPKEVRAELLKELKRRGLDRNYGPDWPSVSAVGKCLAEIRDKVGPGPTKLDRPWSTASLPQHPIPPEALPIVLKVWARSQTREVKVFDPALEAERLEKGITDPFYSWRIPDPEKRDILTIREALWVARLYCVIKQETDESDIDYLDSLWEYAEASARHEYLLNLEDDYPDDEDGILHYWLEDAKLCGDEDIRSRLWLKYTAKFYPAYREELN